MFAETIRLYQGIALMRSADEEFTLDNRWLIKKDRIFLAMRILHMNHKLWNTGTLEDPHPVDQFWADRFLVPSPTTKPQQTG